MFCPMKFINPNKPMEYCQCEREQCEWWNERFGRCSLAVDAFLKGNADWRAERDAERKALSDLP